MRWHGQAWAGAVPRFTAPRHTATAEWRVVPVQRGACGIRAPGHTACKRAAEVHVPDPDVTPPTSGLQVLRGPGRWPPAMAVGAQGSGMAGVQCLPPAGPFPAPPPPPGSHPAGRLSGITSCGGTRPVCGSEDTAVTGTAASRGLLFGISFLAVGLGSRAAPRFLASSAAPLPRGRLSQRPPGPCVSAESLQKQSLSQSTNTRHGP